MSYKFFSYKNPITQLQSQLMKEFHENMSRSISLWRTSFIAMARTIISLIKIEVAESHIQFTCCEFLYHAFLFTIKNKFTDFIQFEWFGICAIISWIHLKHFTTYWISHHEIFRSERFPFSSNRKILFIIFIRPFLWHKEKSLFGFQLKSHFWCPRMCAKSDIRICARSRASILL